SAATSAVYTLLMARRAVCNVALFLCLTHGVQSRRLCQFGDNLHSRFHLFAAELEAYTPELILREVTGRCSKWSRGLPRSFSTCAFAGPSRTASPCCNLRPMKHMAAASKVTLYILTSLRFNK